MAYMASTTEYKTHKAAKVAFKDYKYAAMNLRPDGTASITKLQETPVQVGQAKWIGNPNDIIKKA